MKWYHCVLTQLKEKSHSKSTRWDKFWTEDIGQTNEHRETHDLCDNVGSYEVIEHSSDRACVAWFEYQLLKEVQHPWVLFWRLCAFSQKIKQLWTKYPIWIWSEMFQGTQKLQFYFSLLLLSRDHCCEVIVKNVWKSTFSMFCVINQ